MGASTSALVPLTLARVFFATFDPGAAGAALGIAGLTQRALSLEIHAWYAALGWLAFRRADRVVVRN